MLGLFTIGIACSGCTMGLVSTAFVVVIVLVVVVVLGDLVGLVPWVSLLGLAF